MHRLGYLEMHHHTNRFLHEAKNSTTNVSEEIFSRAASAQASQLALQTKTRVVFIPSLSAAQLLLAAVQVRVWLKVSVSTLLFQPPSSLTQQTELQLSFHSLNTMTATDVTIGCVCDADGEIPSTLVAMAGGPALLAVVFTPPAFTSEAEATALVGADADWMGWMFATEFTTEDCSVILL